MENKPEKEAEIEKRDYGGHYKGDEHGWHKNSDFNDLQQFFENAGLSF